jgi:hypothetical protein
MQNLTVHPGGPSPFLLGPAHARPRSRARALPAPTDRPAPPVSGTAARHCAATHLSDVSPLSVSTATRARRTSPTSVELRPLSGTVRWSGPGPTAPPRRVAPPRPDPHLFPPLSPSATLSSSRSLPAHAAPLVLPSPLLSDPSSRAPEPPHRSPDPDRCLQPPAAHSPSRIPAEHRRRPPLSSELLPELPIPTFSYNFLTPLPL